MKEPRLDVGVVEGAERVRCALEGTFHLHPGGERLGDTGLRATVEGGRVRLRGAQGEELARGERLILLPAQADASSFQVADVTIGIGFHWERRQVQRFRGELHLVARAAGDLLLVNRIPLEDYLESVVASEMSSASPPAFLRAHAVVSRSWLAAQLARRGRSAPPPPAGPVRWYDREDHRDYDVCADDHCQRYQGVPAAGAERAAAAVRATRGLFLVHDGAVCDARFYKACGGYTERYATAWEEADPPYLQAVYCGDDTVPPPEGEAAAAAWIQGFPGSDCASPDPEVLAALLPDFDRETDDFHRWERTLERGEAERLLREKGGIDVGTLLALEPVERGPSARLVRLRIRGTGGEVTVGKELEIRRLLSDSHLFSSAFVATPHPPPPAVPERFHLRGAGWGHGVGMCQIGAGVMAHRGRPLEAILARYFPGAELRRLYR